MISELWTGVSLPTELWLGWATPAYAVSPGKTLQVLHLSLIFAHLVRLKYI